MFSYLGKKIKSRNFWEFFFKNPTFSLRFWIVSCLALLVTASIIFGLIITLGIRGDFEKVTTLVGVVMQGATLIFAVVASYLALRQLVETRINTTEQLAWGEMRRGNYRRASSKWKDTLYMLPEPHRFTNLCEVLLLGGFYDEFDEQISKAEQRFYRNQLLIEDSEKVNVLHLKATRHLLVRNQGEAEKFIDVIREIFAENGRVNTGWKFADLIASPEYSKLTGECRTILDNLINYIDGTMQPEIIKAFELGEYAVSSTATPSA